MSNNITPQTQYLPTVDAPTDTSRASTLSDSFFLKKYYQKALLTGVFVLSLGWVANAQTLEEKYVFPGDMYPWDIYLKDSLLHVLKIAPSSTRYTLKQMPNGDLVSYDSLALWSEEFYYNTNNFQVEDEILYTFTTKNIYAYNENWYSAIDSLEMSDRNSITVFNPISKRVVFVNRLQSEQWVISTSWIYDFATDSIIATTDEKIYTWVPFERDWDKKDIAYEWNNTYIGYYKHRVNQFTSSNIPIVTRQAYLHSIWVEARSDDYQPLIKSCIIDWVTRNICFWSLWSSKLRLYCIWITLIWLI